MRTLFKWAGYDLFRAMVILLEHTVKKTRPRDENYERYVRTLSDINEVKIEYENNNLYNINTNNNNAEEWITIKEIFEVLTRIDLSILQIKDTWVSYIFECELEKRFCTRCTTLDHRQSKVKVKTPNGFRLETEFK